MDCWVLGAYAALQLGPGAANLMGARTAAVTVAGCLRRQCVWASERVSHPPFPPRAAVKVASLGGVLQHSAAGPGHGAAEGGGGAGDDAAQDSSDACSGGAGGPDWMQQLEGILSASRAVRCARGGRVRVLKAGRKSLR